MRSRNNPMSYGLPNGTNIPYGANGFPSWVTALGKAFGLQASTYPDHQESERAEAGYAPNPQRQKLTADEQTRRARLNALTQTVARLADAV